MKALKSSGVLSNKEAFLQYAQAQTDQIINRTYSPQYAYVASSKPTPAGTGQPYMARRAVSQQHQSVQGMSRERYGVEVLGDGGHVRPIDQYAATRQKINTRNFGKTVDDAPKKPAQRYPDHVYTAAELWYQDNDNYEIVYELDESRLSPDHRSDMTPSGPAWSERVAMQGPLSDKEYPGVLRRQMNPHNNVYNDVRQATQQEEGQYMSMSQSLPTVPTLPLQHNEQSFAAQVNENNDDELAKTVAKTLYERVPLSGRKSDTPGVHNNSHIQQPKHARESAATMAGNDSVSSSDAPIQMLHFAPIRDESFRRIQTFNEDILMHLDVPQNFPKNEERGDGKAAMASGRNLQNATMLSPVRETNEVAESSDANMQFDELASSQSAGGSVNSSASQSPTKGSRPSNKYGTMQSSKSLSAIGSGSGSISGSGKGLTSALKGSPSKVSRNFSPTLKVVGKSAGGIAMHDNAQTKFNISFDTKTTIVRDHEDGFQIEERHEPGGTTPEKMRRASSFPASKLESTNNQMSSPLEGSDGGPFGAPEPAPTIALDSASLSDTMLDYSETPISTGTTITQQKSPKSSPFAVPSLPSVSESSALRRPSVNALTPRSGDRDGTSARTAARNPANLSASEESNTTPKECMSDSEKVLPGEATPSQMIVTGGSPVEKAIAPMVSDSPAVPTSILASHMKYDNDAQVPRSVFGFVSAEMLYSPPSDTNMSDVNVADASRTGFGSDEYVIIPSQSSEPSIPNSSSALVTESATQKETNVRGSDGAEEAGSLPAFANRVSSERGDESVEEDPIIPSFKKDSMMNVADGGNDTHVHAGPGPVNSVASSVEVDLSQSLDKSIDLADMSFEKLKDLTGHY
jgi:hypothetical protein